MSDPDATLSRIDEAIDGYVSRDWSTPDAMRWRPDRPTWTDLGRTESGGEVYVAEIGAVDGEALQAMVSQARDAVRIFNDHLRPVIVQYRAAIVQCGKAFVAVQRGMHGPLAPIVYGDEFRRHRRRCRICNPRGNPLPLKADGREYARRLRARRRRRRGGR